MRKKIASSGQALNLECRYYIPVLFDVIPIAEMRLTLSNDVRMEITFGVRLFYCVGSIIGSQRVSSLCGSILQSNHKDYLD